MEMWKRTRSWKQGSPGAPNAMNPMAGSGTQQARRPGAEKAVEVVRNHEDGTSGTCCRVLPKGATRSTSGSSQRERSEDIDRWKGGGWEWTRRTVTEVRKDPGYGSRITGGGADLE